jgi:hypothetical protein
MSEDTLYDLVKEKKAENLEDQADVDRKEVRLQKQLIEDYYNDIMS